MWILGLIVGLHAIAAALFSRGPSWPGTPPDWLLQFHLLLAFSLGITLLLQRSRRLSILLVLLGLQSFALAVANYPGGAHPPLTLLFLCIVVLSLLSRARPPLPAIFLIDAALVFLFNLRPLRSWDASVMPPDLRDVALLFAGLAIASAFLAWVHRLSEALEEKTGQVEAMDNSISNLLQANMEFQNYAIQVGERSTIEERKRLSREIHDIVGYTLINLKMMLESAIDLAGEGNRNLFDLLERARDQAQTSLGETRQVLRAFRDIEKPNLKGVAAIHTVVTLFSRATGIEVDVHYGNIPWVVDEELGLTLCRIVQESMTNSFRHGHATKIQIAFWIADGRLLLKVDDDGQGAAEIRPGIGLLGMQERVERFGGTLSAKNAEYGFSLRAEIPLAPGAGQDAHLRDGPLNVVEMSSLRGG